MNPSDDRADSIIKAALDLTEHAAREALINSACKDDLALEVRVRRLLEAQEHGSTVSEDETVSPEAEAEMARLKPEEAGERIGRYRLMEQLGEGGFGVVWVAEQSEPVRRRVALKIIKMGMDTKEVIGRFEQERQALAMMDHPNIARVFDAGATQHGRPFFVMELVRGVPITDYCDQQELPVIARLELFVQVCQAVQHAHQKGIIHRDLKPSNILVTLADGGPVPKVIDFGVAKATQGRLAEHTVYTQFQQMVGTPRYMSPEQAEMTSLDIDTRSDIYSLGVLLYELLTGCTPIDEQTLARVGLDEIRRAIREVDALRPSTRVKSLRGDELTSTAKRRQIEAAKLPSALRGDLDWIVMKAIEKDRTRRYETANGLAMDVQRYLNGEAILARPPSKLYRIQKTVRRNKLAFAATGLVLAALLVALAIATLSLGRERKARAAALASAKAAQSEADKREQMASFLQDMLARVSSQVAQARDTTRLQEVLGETTARFATELKDKPAVEAELRASLGTIYFDLGDYSTAVAMQEEALRLKDLAGERETKAAAQLINEFGVTLMARGDLDKSAAMLQQAIVLKRKLYGESSPESSDPINDLGLNHWTRGELEEAEKLIRPALELKWKQPEDKKNLSATICNLGLVLWEQGRFAEAEKYLQEGHAMAAAHLGKHPQVAFAVNNLAIVFRDQGNFAEAERLLRQPILLLPDKQLTARARGNLCVVLRRRAGLSDDATLLQETLRLNPTDALAADALAAEFLKPSMIPVSAEAATATGWRLTNRAPAGNWTAPEFQAEWPFSPLVAGMPTYAPISLRIDRSVRFHANLWLRREFDLPNVPEGIVVLRINRCHDAQVFVNGVLATPPQDYTDAPVVVRCSEVGRAAFKKGPNVLAVHCLDADGGTKVDVGVFLTQDASLGRNQLLEVFNRMLEQEPQRAELKAGRAGVLARLGRWREASADLQEAVASAPQAVDYWTQLAVLLIEMGDSAGYNRHRREALSHFVEPDGPSVAAQIANFSLLLPAVGDELKTATKLADWGATARYGDKGLVTRQLAKGLADYRQGQFASAVSSMDQAAANASKQDLIGWTRERERNRTVAAYIVQAMALYQLKQTREAREALAKATGLMQTQFPQMDSGDLGREWPELLIAQILRREAEALIGGASGN